MSEESDKIIKLKEAAEKAYRQLMQQWPVDDKNQNHGFAISALKTYAEVVQTTPNDLQNQIKKKEYLGMVHGHLGEFIKDENFFHIDTIIAVIKKSHPKTVLCNSEGLREAIKAVLAQKEYSLIKNI